MEREPITKSEKQPEQFSRIVLLEQGNGITPPEVSVDDIQRLFPFDPQVITTDFSIIPEDLSTPIVSPDGKFIGFFYRDEKNEEKRTTGTHGVIVRADHHSTNRMTWGNISSTNEAIEYVRQQRKAGIDQYGQKQREAGIAKYAQAKPEDVGRIAYAEFRKNVPIVITHTDADSILAAAILAGYLEPDDIFGEAAIAADHIGAQNDIADLLQAIQDKRDVDYSLNCLFALLAGEPLDEEAQKLLDKRRQDREVTFALKDQFRELPEGVMYLRLDDERKIQGEFLTAMFPDKIAVVTATVLPKKKRHAKDQHTTVPKYEVKVRPGGKFPEGFSLEEDLKLPETGGRWDALATGRKGRTIRPDEYVEYLVERIREMLPGLHPKYVILLRPGETEYGELERESQVQNLNIAMRRKDSSAKQLALAVKKLMEERGIVDVGTLPLNEEGINQIQRTTQKLVEEIDPPDVILASPLLRGQQTAEVLIASWDGIGLSKNDIKQVPELREMQVDPIIQKKYGSNKLAAVFIPELMAMADIKGVGSGKSMTEVVYEMKQVYARLFSTEFNGKGVILVTHSNNYSAMQAILEDWTMDELISNHRTKKPEHGSATLYIGSDEGRKKRLQRKLLETVIFDRSDTSSS